MLAALPGASFYREKKRVRREIGLRPCRAALAEDRRRDFCRNTRWFCRETR